MLIELKVLELNYQAYALSAFSVVLLAMFYIDAMRYTENTFGTHKRVHYRNNNFD